MTSQRAFDLVKAYLRLQARHYPLGMFFRPTTAQLRRVLRDPAVSRSVRNHVYQWLRYRRQRQQR